MVGGHHQLNGHEFEKTPGVGDGQGGLVCCSSWGCKALDTTERLTRTELLTNPQLTSYLTVKTESILPKIRNKTKCPLSPLSFNIILEVPITATRGKKEIKGI